MSKRGTTFYENAELASTISISYKRRPADPILLFKSGLSMAQHYSETADTSRQARKAVRKIDFTGNK